MKFVSHEQLRNGTDHTLEALAVDNGRTTLVVLLL